MNILSKEVYLKENIYQKNVNEISERLKNFIKKTQCPNLKVDISELNFIDATKVAITSSFYHFIKYTKGKLIWIVSDDTIKKSILTMALKNVEVTVKLKNKKPAITGKVVQFYIR